VSQSIFRWTLLPVVCVLLCFCLQGQQTSPPSSSSRPKSKPTVLPSFGQGTSTDGIYRNVFFGFSYKVPFGWVDRTDRMQNESESGQSAVLIALFERPPEAAGDSINSAIVIAAETMSSYPGLKTADEYVARVTELTTAKGFKPAGDPQETIMGGRKFVRADFKREMGSLTMYQSTLVMISKGYIVSFTFIGGSEDAVEKLIASLNFGGAAKIPAKP